MDVKRKEEQGPRESSRPHYEATWTEILKVVKVCGGDIYATKSGHALVRKVGTMLLHFALPKDFDPKNPDKIGTPAPNTIDSIQRNLDIRLPYYPVM